jgi:flagellar biosynthesis protein FlhF
MKIKKIVGENLRDATEKVKNEFGDNAIILSSKIYDDEISHKQLFELTVGIDAEPEVGIDDTLEERKEEIFQEFEEKLRTARGEEDVITIAPSKKIPKFSVSSPGNEKVTKEDLKEIIELLKVMEVDVEIIKIVMNHLKNSKVLLTKDNLKKHVLASLSSLINTTKLNIKKSPEPKIVAVVGPTGVGKTTCIAKLAAITKILHKLEVGIITIDTYRLGAIDQLKIFSEISDIDLLVAYELKDVPAILEKFKDKDLIFIDTVGRSQKNRNELATIKSFLKKFKPSETYLALSSTSSKKNLYDVAERFKIFDYNALIFTKVDEAVDFGNILNVSLNTATPIVYLTNGQVIPDDIIAAESDFIAKIIYNGRLN